MIEPSVRISREADAAAAVVRSSAAAGSCRGGPARVPRATAVVITIDVEPDDAWTDHLNHSVANVRELLRLQELADRFGTRLTLLVTQRVLENGPALRVLERLVSNHGAEIGAHLHPWETPPFLPSRLDERYPAFLHELPLELVGEKLRTLTDLVTRRFGAPASYRAGRWSLIAEHVPVLQRLGYRVDTSVTPLVDWRDKIGIPREFGGKAGVDFRHARPLPYRSCGWNGAPECSHVPMSPRGVQTAAALVEIPVTSVFNRPLPEGCIPAYWRMPLLARRALRKTRMLRILSGFAAEVSERDLVEIVTRCLADRAPVINLALHSSELMVGGSPRSRTPSQVDDFYRRMSAALERVTRASGACEMATLRDLADIDAAVEPPVSDRPLKTPEVTLRGDSRPQDAPPKSQNPEFKNRSRPAQREDIDTFIYILSSSFSGSTLLTLLLASHPQIATVGELKATAMGDVQRYRCSCGTLIRACPFWGRLEEALAHRALSFDVADFGTHFQTTPGTLADRLLRANVRARPLEMARAAALRFVPSARRAHDRIVARNREFIRAIAQLGAANMFLDASKDPVRLRHLLGVPGWRYRVLYLVRDGRGITSSLLRKRLASSAAAAAREWKREQRECRRMLARLPADSVCTLRYEDLCRNAEGTLEQVGRFVGVSTPCRPDLSGEHHVLGNGMRLENASEIRLDDQWRESLSRQDLAEFDRVAGRLNRELGYGD